MEQWKRANITANTFEILRLEDLLIIIYFLGVWLILFFPHKKKVIPLPPSSKEEKKKAILHNVDSIRKREKEIKVTYNVGEN